MICTTAKNNGGQRAQLTIEVTRPGDNTFTIVFVIRQSRNEGHSGESADNLSLAYPCAVEHEGLYVGYSDKLWTKRATY